MFMTDSTAIRNGWGIVSRKFAEQVVFHSPINPAMRWHEVPPTAAPGVLVVDRHALFRHGLIGLLQSERADWPCAECGSLAEMALRIDSVDLVLLDLTLPELNGVEGLCGLLACYPQHGFVVIADDDSRDTILHCLAAGARGYLLKSTSPPQMLRALDMVRDGGVYAPASLYRPSVPTPAPAPPPPVAASALAGLTDRQREVFALLAEGCTTKAIARRLDLGVGTVKVHLAAIYRSFGAHTRLEVLAKANRL
jgi:DNA-binding NarL/FixJ family response regulator